MVDRFTTGKGFPKVRMRRMRRSEFSRRLMRETRLSVDNLIYPVFIMEGQGREPVPSMPGVERLGLDALRQEAAECVALGLPALVLFPVTSPDKKATMRARRITPRVWRSAPCGC